MKLKPYTYDDVHVTYVSPNDDMEHGWVGVCGYYAERTADRDIWTVTLDKPGGEYRTVDSCVHTAVVRLANLHLR